MAFGDFVEKNPNASKSIAQIESEFNAWKENKTKIIHFLLVKDCGLRSDVEFSFETKGGKKVHTVHFRDRGVSTTFEIEPSRITLVKKESLNDTENGAIYALEDALVEEQMAILEDYFSMQPSDRPEYLYPY